MKLRIVAAALVIFLVLVIAMLWQHFRYSDIRRERAQDQQELLHGESLHVLTYLKATTPSELLDSLRELSNAAETQGAGRLVYAGKVIQNALVSTQVTEALGENVQWDAIILQQFAHRAGYDTYLQDHGVQSALSEFSVRFSHGMKRSALTNLLLPQVLLFRDLQRTVMRAPAIVPFEKVADVSRINRTYGAAQIATVEGGLGEDAVVVVNLMLEGDADQSAANANYGNQMLSLFAEQQHGPIHMGESVPLELPLNYTNVAVVYYPGIRYFTEMRTSTFFQGIVGDKQLADTMVSITAPMTNQL